MGKKLIKNGLVVNVSGVCQMDILIEDEKIIQIGKLDYLINCDDIEVTDATNMYVMPGLIEPHVHFDSPFMGGTTDHDLLTGTKACAYGGITSVISFSNQSKGESLIKNVQEWDSKNKGKAYVDWSMHGIVYDSSENSMSEIPQLVEMGIPTYKCFTTYKHSGRLVDDDSMLKILATTANSNGMLMIHCEHDATCEYLTNKAIDENKKDWIYHAKTRPAMAENMAIQRIIDLMKLEPAPVYIVHATTKESVDIILSAQKENLPIKVETCTHYLLLTEDELKKENGYLYICSPPLRKQDDLDRLWSASNYGPIEIISSDDAGMPSKMREELSEGRFDKVPSGMPGVEPRLTLLYSEGVLKERITINKLVELTSTNPAKIFGLNDKGNILPGYDADIVIFDPNIDWIMKSDTLHMNTDFCPFEGLNVKGKAKNVFVRGELVLDNFELVGSPSHGKRIHRKLQK